MPKWPWENRYSYRQEIGTILVDGREMPEKSHKNFIPFHLQTQL